MKTTHSVTHPTAALRTSRPVCQLILSMAALAGFALHAQAATFEVGGAGIGDSTLTSAAGLASLPSYWSTAGGAGVVYSNLTSATLTVPAGGGVTLKFNHRYYLEGAYDGGAVYISVNGGAFTQVPSSAFTANGYNANLSGSSAFAGLDVFNGQSAGWDTPAYIESVATLGSFAMNDTIAVQFRGGWDEGYAEAAPNWEISTVDVRQGTSNVMLNVDFAVAGKSGFTVTSDAGLAGPWKYQGGPLVRFELDATGTTSADKFVPDTPGVSIDLSGASLSVVLLNGTLALGQSYSLFDLSGGTSLEGYYNSITLPTPPVGASWNVSGLAPGGNGQIVLEDSSGWIQTAEGTTYNWGDSGNWDNGVPNSVGKVANFRLDLAGAQTISLNQAYTVGAINLGDTTSTYYGVDIAAGTAGSLIMDGSAGSAAIARTNGSNVKDTISADITLNDNLNVSDANGAYDLSKALTLSGAISGSGKSVTISGNGTVYLSGTNTFDGGLILSGNGATGGVSNYYIKPSALGTNCSLTISGGNIGTGTYDGANWTNQPLNGNAVFINDDFLSHPGVQTGTGTVTISRAGILAKGQVIIQGVVTGPGGLNGLDINLFGLEGMGTTAAITSDITMRGDQIMTHDSGWGLQAWPPSISGIISDGGNGYKLTKAGTSETVLAAANTYSGDTNVTGGALTLGNPLALQNSALVTSPNAFELQGSVTTLTLGGLKGSTDIVTTFTLYRRNIYNGQIETTYHFNQVTELTLNPGIGKTCTYTGAIANGASGMTLIKTGAGTQELGGVNTYSGDTTVSAGALTLADNGGLTFVLTNTSSNGVKGTGTVTFNGDFYLNASAVTNTTGSWTLVDVTNLTETFGTSFSMAGAGWSQTSNVWTTVDGTQLWTFNEATGVLTLAVAGPEIAVEESAANISNNGTKAFGEVLVGSPKLLTFTIKNTGVTNLTDLAITTFGTHKDDFAVTQVDPAAPVLPAGTTTFTVTFTPGGIGARTAYIEIANNDVDESPFTINLSGTGIDAFASWAVTNITARDEHADASTTGDPDGDGSDNLTEYAFAGDPLSGTDNPKVYSWIAPSSEDRGNELILTVAVLDVPGDFVAAEAGLSRTATSTSGGITYIIQGSDNLVFPGAGVLEVGDQSTLEMRDLLPAGYAYRSFVLADGGLAGKGFLRAKVLK